MAETFSDLGDLFSGSNKRQPSKFNVLSTKDDPMLPSREDIIDQVLNEQLNVLKRRRGQALGESSVQSEDPTLASSAIFGV